MFGWRAIASLAVIVAATTAHAQRRGGGSANTVLEVTLKSAVKFGDIVVPASRYRISVSVRGLSFAHPTTMVAVATVPATETASAETVQKPTVEVVEKGADEVQIIVRSLDRVVVAKGVKTTVERKRRDVELVSRHQADLGAVVPEQKTEVELIHHALSKRYIRDVKHCADKAHRSRWQTDDKRFWNCVCPLADRWRLPKVSADVRVHEPLAKGKSGISITVTPDGKVKDCRVWVGAEPPADERAKKEKPASGTAVAAETPPAPATPATDKPPAEKAPEPAEAKTPPKDATAPAPKPAEKPQ
jgi:hypothetical protein